MNPVLSNELSKHTVIVSTPVPLGEALLIIGGFMIFCMCIIKFFAPWLMKEMDKW
ncbi:MAG: hypothetical protein H8D94_01830 [Candidatus Pelagibacter sp.]|nr:hypothetical protein [Candidatus Pelagibacter sp.]